MQAYQKRLTDLLLDYGALRLGEFRLKSGALSPYFVNFGRIGDGRGLEILGEVFADCLQARLGLDGFDFLIGPAYKGIPLATATAVALQHKYGVNKGISYNRKERKDHGADAGDVWVGGEIPAGARLVIVDDVFTTGGAKVEILDELKKLPVPVKPVALLVGVDRQQHPQLGGQNYQEFCARYGLRDLAVVSVSEVIEEMRQSGKLPAEQAERIQRYIETGAL